jgi:hypothetical protein
MSDFIVERYISSQLCDDIIDEFHRQQPSWTDSTRGYWLVSSDMMNQDLVQRYKDEIFSAISFYKEVYSLAFEGFQTMRLEEPFNFQKYSPGFNYSTWHCENNGKEAFNKRVLAFMTYLNTVEVGGETEFLHQKMKSKPIKGKTLVWPAYFTHTHKGLPAPRDKKYIVTGWIEFAPWEDVSLDESDEDFYLNLDLATRTTW